MKADLLIVNSSQLLTVKSLRGFRVGEELLDLGIIENGAAAIVKDKIAAVGTTSEITKKFPKLKKIIDAKNQVVMPGLIDPHTHLVYWGSRAHEYEAKILGKSYSELHQISGNQKTGILYTVEQTRRAAKKNLIAKALRDLKTMLQYGTTTIEAKSGYGLDQKNEIKILEVIKELKKLQPIEIVPTFLGAHTVPEAPKKTLRDPTGQEYKNHRKKYVNLVKELLPEIKRKKLAEFCDVFCDKLGFTLEESREILETAQKLGFKIKLHAEQTEYTGGTKLGVELKATSCDHLDYINDENIKLMAQNKIAGVLLPTVTYHLMEICPNPAKNYEITKPFLPERIRKMIDSNIIIALASDYNPGSSPCLSMKTAMECAARLYRMRPAEIISACTINAAYAIGRQNSIGSLEPGKKADIIILDCPDWRELINSFGTNIVKTVVKKGKITYSRV